MQIEKNIQSETKKDKKKKRKRKIVETSSNDASTDESKKPLKRKIKDTVRTEEEKTNFKVSKSEVDPNAETTDEQTSEEKKDSIRKKKRLKLEKMLAEQKQKSEVASQQKALNYLSQWKHNRNGWKFEKLRQVWLQQNLYNNATIPDEFWDTAREYFSNSKGQSKQSIIKDANKIIETVEENENEELTEEVTAKLERARDILQHLQE